MGLEYHPGALLVHPNAIERSWAPGMAQTADLTIACIGSSPLLEGEEGESLLTRHNGDREGIRLPASQVGFIKQLAIHGAKIVLVVTGGSPLALGEVEDMVEAILFVWYPGQEGGKAVADVLFGEVSPAGKLPLTFPKSLDQLPPFEDYGMAGRTYRYMTEEPLYPFGFGLSYSRFEYGDLALEKTAVKAGETLNVSVAVQNTGERAAAEVIQFYLSDLEASTTVPLHHLVGFERVFLQPGESRTLQMGLTPEMLSFFDEQGKPALESGEFRLEAGGCSPGNRGFELGAARNLAAVFRVI
jgi:beta-glucosidase